MADTLVAKKCTPVAKFDTVIDKIDTAPCFFLLRIFLFLLFCPLGLFDIMF